MSDPLQTYVLRLSGTISTKSARTRRRFNRRLERNIRDALDRRGFEYEFENDWSRMFVESRDPEAGDVLRRIFGIQGVRPSEAVEWETLEDIVREGHRRYADRVDGRTFGVASRRVGPRDRFPCTSVDINRELGGALDEVGGEVDLDDPEIEVRLEAHHDRVYFFDEELDGPGGLPIGTEGRALALVSGGFDSVVAAWEMLKRGVALDFVFFNLAGPPHERGVREVLAELAEWISGDDPRIHVVDFRPLLADLKSDVAEEYWQVVLKRLMMESAARIARDSEPSSLVTGEAIGQVSSQTLANLGAIEAAIDLPVFRPLISANKQEIVARARSIGVHGTAERVPEFCGLAGGNPVTNTTAARIDEHCESFDDERVLRWTENRRTLRLREFVDDDSARESVQVERIPDEAALLDLRDEEAYESWHAPDAMHVPFETAVEEFAMLPREPTWLLYCEVGLKSAFVAEKMRAIGFDAHSYRGGVPRMRRQLDETSAPAS